jgi:phosphatidylglycerophosphatase A
MEEIRQHCLKVASFWGVGEWFGGSIIASLFAFVILFLGKATFLLSNSAGYIFYSLFYLLSFLIVWLALSAISEKDSSIIVLDKIVGMTITLSGIVLRVNHWKLLAIGFASYHVLLFIKSIFLRFKYFRKIEELPGAFGIFGVDIVFGLGVNIVLRLVQWLAF